MSEEELDVEDDPTDDLAKAMKERYQLAVYLLTNLYYAVPVVSSVLDILNLSIVARYRGVGNLKDACEQCFENQRSFWCAQTVSPILLLFVR